MPGQYNPSIRFECDEEDKVLARAISQRYGGASMSATMRRLIRCQIAHVYVPRVRAGMYHPFAFGMYHFVSE